MNNLEFYTPQENWPQPADDPATLLPADPPEAVKKKQKKKRLRKKMSESLSGMTAAALAVVMLTTAVFDEKGGFGGGFDASPPGAVCSICHDPTCLYFVEGTPGLRLKGAVIDASSGLYAPYDLYKMNGHTSIFAEYCTDELGITTRNLERLIFRLDSDVCNQYGDGMRRWWWAYHQDIIWNKEDPDDRTGICFTLRDTKSGEYYGFLLAFLVYAPNGLPGYNPNLLQEAFPHHAEYLPDQTQNLEFRTIDVPGYPDAQIQLYSDLGSDYLDVVEKACSVDVVPALATQELGKTMLFRETEKLFRSYNDWGTSASVYQQQLSTGVDAELWTMLYDFTKQEYGLRSSTFPGEMSIRLLPDVKGQDWTVLLERSVALNKKAGKTGHLVYFQMEQLDLLTVNGITYDCWMAYTPEKNEATGETRYRPKYMLVPVQEPTVMLSYDIEILSEEELAAVRQDSTDYFNEQMPYLIDRLNQISLR